MAISSVLSGVSVSSSVGVSLGSIRLLIDAANGRAVSIFLSAPFSFDAATIFMALVIFAVPETDFSRMPMALMDGMAAEGTCAGRGGRVSPI